MRSTRGYNICPMPSSRMLKSQLGQPGSQERSIRPLIPKHVHLTRNRANVFHLLMMITLPLTILQMAQCNARLQPLSPERSTQSPTPRHVRSTRNSASLLCPPRMAVFSSTSPRTTSCAWKLHLRSPKRQNQSRSTVQTTAAQRNQRPLHIYIYAPGERILLLRSCALRYVIVVASKAPVSTDYRQLLRETMTCFFSMLTCLSNG
jgi:hypothetical protein